jgi:hypothetical protein
MKSMNTPRTRAEFERNFHLLHRKMAEDKVCFSERVTHTLDSIARLRYLPNGRIDFLSVDESARCLVNTMNQFSEESFQEQLKEHKGPSDVSTGAKEGEPPAGGSVGPSDMVD